MSICPHCGKAITKPQHIGGCALAARRGRAYMRSIGSKGFWSAITAIAQRQLEAGSLSPTSRHNTFKGFLRWCRR